MPTRKFNIIIVLALLLLSAVTACQAAAPPVLPAGVVNSGGNTPAQDNLDTAGSLPESAQPAEAIAPSTQDDGDSRLEIQPFLQGADTSSQDDDDDGDDLDDDSLLENGLHPVANTLAQEFNVDYEEIVKLHQAGYGFGEIAKAYSLADELGMTPQEILPRASDVGWGKLLKDNGLHPSLAGKGNNLGAIMSRQKGKGNRPAHAGPPGGDGPPGLIKKSK